MSRSREGYCLVFLPKQIEAIREVLLVQTNQFTSRNVYGWVIGPVYPIQRFMERIQLKDMLPCDTVFSSSAPGFIFIG